MKKRVILLTILWICIIGLVLTIGINCYMILSTKSKIIELDNIDNVDAILLLGCKVDGDTPSLMLSKRLEKTLDVYNKVKTKVVISGDSTRENYDEVGVMYNYLRDSIPNDDLILDKEGISTYDSLYRIKNTYGFNKIVIITQEYHMYRALYLADKLDIDSYGIVANDIPQKIVMLKNRIREIFARDKNFFKGIIKPSIGYVLIK